jgi:hypothetical protein
VDTTTARKLRGERMSANGYGEALYAGLDALIAYSRAGAITVTAVPPPPDVAIIKQFMAEVDEENEAASRASGKPKDARRAFGGLPSPRRAKASQRPILGRRSSLQPERVIRPPKQTGQASHPAGPISPRRCRWPIARPLAGPISSRQLARAIRAEHECHKRDDGDHRERSDQHVRHGRGDQGLSAARRRRIRSRW